VPAVSSDFEDLLFIGISMQMMSFKVTYWSFPDMQAAYRGGNQSFTRKELLTRLPVSGANLRTPMPLAFGRLRL
jgi:hypothetical protein